jgi:hypothetical protein
LLRLSGFRRFQQAGKKENPDGGYPQNKSGLLKRSPPFLVVAPQNFRSSLQGRAFGVNPTLWCDSDEEYPKGYLSNILLTPRLL